MKLHLKYLWIVLVACTLTACMNGGGDLAGKWQLRQYQYADGTSEKVDSVFYNFQKEVFCHMFVERWRVDYVFWKLFFERC